MPRKNIVILASEGLTTNLLFECLTKHYNVIGVIIEERESKSSIIKRRMKKNGFFSTMGQVAFMLFVFPLIRSFKRIKDVLKLKGYDGAHFPQELVHEIEDVNSKELTDLITHLKPDLIFLNGTKIIQSDILKKIAFPMVNIHVGITPQYRGVHGGYWALYENKPEFFGTTIHYVDSGVDTGEVIDQVIITPTKSDNFKTYPILQYIAGLELIEKNIEVIGSGEIPATKRQSDESKLHFHPRACQYILKRLFKGVR